MGLIDNRTGRKLTAEELTEAFDQYIDADGPVEVYGLTLKESEILKAVRPHHYIQRQADWVEIMVLDGEYADLDV